MTKVGSTLTLLQSLVDNSNAELDSLESNVQLACLNYSKLSTYFNLKLLLRDKEI